MNYDVCVAADGRREVCVQGRIQRIMAVFGYVEHACAEVLSPVGRFEAEELEDAARSRVLDSFEGAHEGAS